VGGRAGACAQKQPAGVALYSGVQAASAKAVRQLELDQIRILRFQLFMLNDFYVSKGVIREYRIGGAALHSTENAD
jgi:hypothetical protein